MTISKQKMMDLAFARSEGLREFFEAYVECLIWSEGHGGGYSPANGHIPSPGVGAITLGGIREILSDCERFMREAGEMVVDDPSQAGHDFCLTRNGHGAGFDDGDWPENGKGLTDLCEKCGGQGLQMYRGKLYVHG